MMDEFSRPYITLRQIDEAFGASPNRSHVDFLLTVARLCETHSPAGVALALRTIAKMLEGNQNV